MVTLKNVQYGDREIYGQPAARGRHLTTSNECIVRDEIKVMGKPLNVKLTVKDKWST